MAWLIYGVPIKPAFQPHFDWLGVTDKQKQDLGRGARIDPPVPEIVGTQTSANGQVHPLPDIFKGCNAWIVCEEFKRIVDALEPEQNQFLPVSLVDEIRRKVPRQYYVLNVTQKQETLDLQKSYVHSSWQEIKTESGEVKRIQSWHLDPMPAPLFAEKGQVAGRHVWRGSHHFLRYMFFSDELMKRVKKAKLKELRAYPVTEE